MIQVNLAGPSTNFTISAHYPTCNLPCGGKWKRRPHSSNLFTIPYCMECGQTPKSFRLKKYHKGKSLVFTVDSMGRRITPHNVLDVSRAIDRDLAAGTYVQDNYRKNKKRLNVKLTVGEYIEQRFLKMRCLAPHEREFLQEFMAPFFQDVGTFVFGRTHLDMFISMFNIRNQEKEMATKLFERLQEQLQEAA